MVTSMVLSSIFLRLMLIDASNKQIKVLKEIPQKVRDKPLGLWYTPKNEWINYDNENILNLQILKNN